MDRQIVDALIRMTTKMEVQEAVLTFLRSKNEIPGLTEDEQLACEYLDVGVVDSVGIIEMVICFEKQFDIHFGPEDMQSTEFRTIGGLIGLIEHLMKEKVNGKSA